MQAAKVLASGKASVECDSSAECKAGQTASGSEAAVTAQPCQKVPSRYLPLMQHISHFITPICSHVRLSARERNCVAYPGGKIQWRMLDLQEFPTFLFCERWVMLHAPDLFDSLGVSRMK